MGGREGGRERDRKRERERVRYTVEKAADSSVKNTNIFSCLPRLFVELILRQQFVGNENEPNSL